MALFYKNNINITGVDDPYISSSNITPTMEVTGFIYPDYIIDNWNTEADGSGTKYAIGEVVEDSSYYAIWKKPPKYLVTAEQLETVADAIRENCTFTDTKLSYPWGFIEGIDAITNNNKFKKFLNGTMSNLYLKVNSIRDSAFYNNSNLTSIIFPDCTTIEKFAFYNCSNLTTINFPACTTIGNSAFNSCSKLTSINFPACNIIGSYAFRSCSKLTSVNFPSCTTIGGSAFYNCYNLTTVNSPACISIGNCGFNSCSKLTSINFPACTRIESYAFSKCYKLLSAYFLNSSVPSLLNSNAFSSTPMRGYTSYTSGIYGSIFVRASMLEAFKSATNWAYYSSRFVGLTDEEIASLEN